MKREVILVKEKRREDGQERKKIRGRRKVRKYKKNK